MSVVLRFVAAAVLAAISIVLLLLVCWGVIALARSNAELLIVGTFALVFVHLTLSIFFELKDGPQTAQGEK